MDKELVKLYVKLHSQCIDQMIKEKEKGTNRAICIIREYGRKWEKESILIDINSKPDGFIKLFKKKLLEISDIPEEFLNALKYL